MRWPPLSAGELAALCKTNEDPTKSRTVTFDAEAGDAGRGLKNPSRLGGNEALKETHTLHPTPSTPKFKP
jgi:hypothetical protein